MEQNAPHKVRVLVNRRSGLPWSFKKLQVAFENHWDTPGNDLTYQFCKDAEDGRIKAQRAVEQGVEVLLVVGGDGTINSIGSALIGTNTILAAVPMGSGNGFARHFGISLNPEKAVGALVNGNVRRIDVGIVNLRPFFVTCSMAWDAAIVRSFQRFPVRGILPYVFAGVYEFFDYRPEPLRVVLDSGECLSFPDPMVFTVANLTQYGANLQITADAEPDDGLLELVAARKQDFPVLFNNIMSLTTRPLSELPKVVHRKFKKITVERANPGMMQLDGELCEAPKLVEIEVLAKSLRVLVPRDAGD